MTECKLRNEKKGISEILGHSKQPSRHCSNYIGIFENTFIEMAYMDELIVCEDADILPTA